MTSEFNARSFGTARERVAPDTLSGHWSDGTATTLALSDVTLIVAIKPRCDGCRAFIDADLAALAVPVVIISEKQDELDEWRDARQPVLVAPEVFRQLDIRWPPLYVLIDPKNRRVLSEGALFDPAQVASEIARYLKN